MQTDTIIDRRHFTLYFKAQFPNLSNMYLSRMTAFPAVSIIDVTLLISSPLLTISLNMIVVQRLHIWLALENTPTASLQSNKCPTNECPTYDTKQSNGEIPIMTGLWGMRSTHLLSSFPCPLWPAEVKPDIGPELNCHLY